MNIFDSKPARILRILIVTVLVAAFLSVIAGCPSRPVKIASREDTFTRAEKKYQAGLYDRALALYEQFIRAQPGSRLIPEALMKKGQIHQMKKEYPAAINAYKRLIRRYPDSLFVSDAHANIVVSLYLENRFEEVVEYVRNVFVQNPERVFSPRIYVLSGNAAMAAGFYSDAVYYYSHALEKRDLKDRELVILNLEKVIERLTEEEIKSLLKREDLSEETRNYLSYLLSRKKYYRRGEFLKESQKKYGDFIREYSPEEKAAYGEKPLSIRYGERDIGCLLPLSGSFSSFGKRALRGIEAALGQSSVKYGRNLINLVFRDTESDPDTTARSLMELEQEGVLGIIGPMVTSEMAAREAEFYRIPIVCLTQKMGISKGKDFVFRNFLTPKMQVRSLVDYAINRLGVHNFAILFPGDKYGNTFMELFWDEVIAMEGKVVGVESYIPGQTDFSESIKKLTGAFYRSGQSSGSTYPESRQSIEAVFIPDSPKNAGLIIPQLAFYDIDNVFLFGTNIWHSQKLIQLGEKFVNGAILTEGFFAESKIPRVQNFVTEFEKVYGEKPGFVEAIAYDTCMMIVDLLARFDIQSRQDLRDALSSVNNYPGVTGMTDLDDNGEVHKDMFLLQIQGDKFVEITDR